ncbi:ATP-binding protein [Hoeflea sp. AS60]|uniref:ATP-binding protein n=1 Tax=Hoeflea sp. AS60 TaxID=3135780 RepID=UPI0031793D3A
MGNNKSSLSSSARSSVSDNRQYREASEARQFALSQITQLALRSAEIDLLFSDSARIVAAAMGADQVGIFEISEDRRTLRLCGGCGWPANTIGRKSVPAAVCRPLYEAIYAEDAVRFARGDALNVFGARTRVGGNGLALPIGNRDQRAGVLTITAREDTGEFDEAEISFLRTIAFILAAVWERQRFEATLKLRNRALEALEQGIMITDARRLDDPLIYVNPAFERLTGYSAEEAMGKNPRFLAGEDTAKPEINDIREAVKSGGTCRRMFINYRKDGGTFSNELTVSPVRNEAGEITQHVGIMADVSERVELESQLRQAQKMEAIGHLTGGIAHDFNNLLAIILGNSEILLEDIEDGELRQAIELVMSTAQRGAVLTQRLLAFGRRQALSPEPLAIGQVLHSLADMLRRTLGEPVELVTDDQSGEHLTMIDRCLFESALLNLAVNARDAMPNGGKLVITSDVLWETDGQRPADLGPGAYIKVTVRDTGIGMSPDVLAKAFEPFFTTKDVGRGSGLGLAMVYGFAKQSGGHVSIESEPSEGTSVNLFLPVTTEKPKPRVPETQSQEPMPKGSERILLVEDEIEVRRFVARLLARLGYSVIEADNAAMAMAALKKTNGIDLIFSDLILPGGTNGLQLVEEAQGLQPGLRVLLTTGYTEEYEKLAMTTQAPVLRKPYRRQELAVKLRLALERMECASNNLASSLGDANVPSVGKS